MQTIACPQTETPKLTATEKKLLDRIEHQAKAQTPPRPWLYKLVMNTAFGFHGW